MHFLRNIRNTYLFRIIVDDQLIYKKVNKQ